MLSKTYSELSRTSKMQLFAKIVTVTAFNCCLLPQKAPIVILKNSLLPALAEELRCIFSNNAIQKPGHQYQFDKMTFMKYYFNRNLNFPRFGVTKKKDSQKYVPNFGAKLIAFFESCFKI